MSQIEAALREAARSLVEQADGEKDEAISLVPTHAVDALRAALSQQSPAPSPDVQHDRLCATLLDKAWAGDCDCGALASPAPSVEPAAPIGHLHFNGDFCLDRMPRETAWWPIPLYAAPTAAVHEPEARDQVHPAQAIGGGKAP